MERIKWLFRLIKNSLSRNLGWKIFSVVVAVIMWSYIVTNDPTITRDKVLSGVEVTTSGLAVLQSRDLALLTEPLTAFTDVRVRVQAPQASYARVNSDNVRVELDLSQIRQTGKQEIELTGVSAYGTVTQISPARVEVVVEKLDERVVPINVELVGEKDDAHYWYSAARTNPSTISVSGPSSVVQTVTSARVQLDVTGVTSSYSWTAAPELLNSAGEVIAHELSRSSSSVTAGVSIYPIKHLAVATDPATATTGSLPEGFEVTRIEVQPEWITVAADLDLLNQLEMLTFTPVNVTGRKQSFSVTTTLNGLKDIQYMSSEQVTVTVYISEENTAQVFRSVPLSATGRREGRQISLDPQLVTVRVSGPYSQVESLVRGDLIATVDVGNLGAGTHQAAVSVAADSHPDLMFEVEPAEVSVTVRE